MVTGTLADMIEAQYHSMSGLTQKLSAAAVGVQGSGWAWLGYDKINKRLAIATCANQVLGAIRLSRLCICSLRTVMECLITRRVSFSTYFCSCMSYSIQALVIFFRV